MTELFDRNKGPHGPFFAPPWDLGSVTLSPEGRPLVMGILNLTPDSFHADSRHLSADTAVATALEFVAQGADILDLGAESSRPGAKPITATEEQDRLLPILEAIRRETDCPITVDTMRSETARQALASGANAINDISAATTDKNMLHTVADAGCGLILMHMQGVPQSMQDQPAYDDVVGDVTAYLQVRCRCAEDAGIKADRVMVDPGIGFGKTLQHNLLLLKSLKTIADGRPLLLGASRKSFIDHLLNVAVEDRLPGSLAALAMAWQGRSTLVRVHDVAASVQFLETLKAAQEA